MPDLICANCHAPHTIAAGVDPDRYAATIGMSRMPSVAVRITAVDRGPTAARATNAMRPMHAPGAILAHEQDGLASWLLDAGAGVVAMLAEMGPGLGLIVDTDAVPPFPASWFCGRGCRTQAFTRETVAPDTCHDGGTARTRALLASKGPAYDRERDPQQRVDCPVCGQHAHVPLLADAARYLTPLGWRINKASDRWVCSAACWNVSAPVAPPVDTAAAAAAADKAFTASLHRERAVHAPLRSDATTRGKAGSR